MSGGPKFFQKHLQVLYVMLDHDHEQNPNIEPSLHASLGWRCSLMAQHFIKKKEANLGSSLYHLSPEWSSSAGRQTVEILTLRFLEH